MQPPVRNKQILGINYREPVFHKQLRRYSGTLDQRPGKCAIISLLHPAAGASRLQHNQIWLFMSGNFQTFSCACPEFRIYASSILAVTLTPQISDGTRGVGKPPICSGQTGIT